MAPSGELSIYLFPVRTLVCANPVPLGMTDSICISISGHLGILLSDHHVLTGRDETWQGVNCDPGNPEWGDTKGQGSQCLHPACGSKSFSPEETAVSKEVSSPQTFPGLETSAPQARAVISYPE